MRQYDKTRYGGSYFFVYLCIAVKCKIWYDIQKEAIYGRTAI